MTKMQGVCFSGTLYTCSLYSYREVWLNECAMESRSRDIRLTANIKLSYYIWKTCIYTLCSNKKWTM